ncbi:MAG: nucleoside deaminase [Clostridia bacterium]|nr:nucleoside deaminase [Clostridia bacterium]
MNYMKEALREAGSALSKNEIPIGAVIVKNGEIISRSHNMCEEKKNPLLHAEINAISDACRILNSKYLDDCELYVTVEPCPMCATAIGLAKIKRIYVGCEEPKTGALGSVINIEDHMPWHNEVYFGFCEDECKGLIKSFFKDKR